MCYWSSVLCLCWPPSVVEHVVNLVEKPDVNLNIMYDFVTYNESNIVINLVVTQIGVVLCVLLAAANKPQANARSVANHDELRHPAMMSDST